MAIPAELEDEAAILAYLGLSAGELKKIWYYRGRMYQHFSIAKGPDKIRMISAPDDRLKFLQRQLSTKLSELYRPRNPVHGFVADRSVKTNAIAHLHRRFVINIDLKDFFPSITQNRVEGMLTSLGINARVAEIIARICCNNGHLPQGAPSSPVLSNMICFRLDKKLLDVAKKARCIYTRYADDITFSSYQPPTALFEVGLPPAGHFAPELLAVQLRSLFQQNGFIINPDKTHYADRHSRRVVTGVKINEMLNVDRRYVRNIRAALRSIEVLGIDGAEKKFREQHGGRSDLASFLRGKISYLTHIKGSTDPVVRHIALRFNNCFPARPIKVSPTVTEMRDRSVWVVDNNHTIEQGTAFFLKDVGLVTAEHCLGGAEEVEVFHPSKPANKFRARVLRVDKHRDLALLEHSIPITEFFELERSAQVVALGDHLTAIGYPAYSPGDSINVRGGTVASFKVQSLVDYIEVTQILAQGMSGGPLIDTNNNVVGIIHKGGPGEGRNLAVAIKMLNDWLLE
ncbi:reverse transcriptase domain-containing protein [Ferrovibrio sp.]|uniref:reverse transcriptase domain-containing protein n=1 Tax=Ferrovibrio sp. TaxID=1917215 RepID=UPI0035B4F5AF